MSAYTENVPIDISTIHAKGMFNLTKRQLICFGLAGATGVPLYFLTKNALGTQLSSLMMVGIMMPFFFFALYEKDGFPAEKLLFFMIRQKYLLPGVRPYQTENILTQMERRQSMRREVKYLEEKSGKRRKGKTGTRKQ